MIKLERICKLYRTDEVETHALNNIDLEVRAGEFVAVMGPSGCGKSTLLNVLGLLDAPDSGAYRFRGTDVAAYNEEQRSALRRGQIGFIFQNFNLIDELTVAENVALALLYHENIPRAEREDRVRHIMDRMSISHRARHMPTQLSGGQQQRVAVARALVANPSLILADEPTGNLDTKHGQEIMDLLVKLNQGGTTIVMVTHSPAHARYAHRTVNFLDGRVVAEPLAQAV
jgi:putative ABC transport system ATP-binding protein